MKNSAMRVKTHRQTSASPPAETKSSETTAGSVTKMLLAQPVLSSDEAEPLKMSVTILVSLSTNSP